MRIAYADPPYLGQANKYPEKQEVDHERLIAQLESFDGWALSCSSPSLKTILPMCPDDIRIGAWVKSFASFKPNVNPAYVWEPVIFKPARGYERKALTIRDWIEGVITLRTGMIGAKPYYFCTWFFEILGADYDDEFYDLFPGSGAVTRSWESWSKCRQFNRWLKRDKSSLTQ